MKEKCRLGVLVSGSGTNLQALMEASQETSYPAEVKIVISNVPEVMALKRAQKRNLPTATIPHKNFASREEFEKKLLETLKGAGVDLVVLAGFMRILSPFFVKAYPGRILNIHPSLLPKFPGVNAIQQAWEGREKVTGVTVHFVDEGTDTGPVVLQREVPIHPGETLESLTARVHQVEHQIYPEAVRLFAEEKLKIKNHQVLIKIKGEVHL